MKYAIKEVNSDYVQVSQRFYDRAEYGFGYYQSIDNATIFSSIADAIDVIVKRAVVPNGASQRRFTIVGVKEVSTPRYAEVVL